MPTTGKFSWAVVLCKFSDQPQEPHPTQFFVNLLSEKLGGSLSDYWATMSYSNLDMSNPVVYGWVQMSSVAHDAAFASLSRWDKTEVCIDAAGVSLGDPLFKAKLIAYDGIIVIVN